MKMYGGVDVKIHVFLASALVVGDWSASRSGRFIVWTLLRRERNLAPPGIEPCICTIQRRMVGWLFNDESERIWKEGAVA
jgi:hypothetical protein